MTLGNDWSENELTVVESCPNEKSGVQFGDVKLTEICQVLTPTQVQNVPKVTWSCQPDTLYSVFMTDPDAPSRKDPSFREWFHWGIINVPGNNIDQGETIAEYVGAGPPKGTGLHRYVILIYAQQGQVTFEDPKLALSAEGRGGTKLKKVVDKYNLGSPVSGACFQAEYDEYVPKLYKSLGM